MKKNKRLIGAITSFAAASACLIGGTYAWFVVANTAETQIIGTIAEIEDVQIGIKSTTKLVKAGGISEVDCLAVTDADLFDNYGLIKDAVRADVYWSHDNSVGATNGDPLGSFMKTGLLELVAGLNGYGKVLTPVTTGSYVSNTNQEIILKKGLDSVPSKAFVDGYRAASLSDYLSYTLVFQTPEPTTKIHLKSTGTSITSESDPDVVSSLRVGFTDEKNTPAVKTDDKTSIFKFATSTGSTNVGGRMDLNGDDAWDYFELGGKEFEIFYGEFDEYNATETTVPDFISNSKFYGVTYDANPVTTGIAKSALVDGVNDNYLGSGNTKSLIGAYTFDAGSTLTPKTQTHNSLSYYIPGQNEIITTDSTGYGELTIKVWAEGWDEKCINDISSGQYTVNLTFVTVLS